MGTSTNQFMPFEIDGAVIKLVISFIIWHVVVPHCLRERKEWNLSSIKEV